MRGKSSLQKGEIRPIKLQEGMMMPQFSNFGRVRNEYGEIYTPTIDDTGYARVTIDGYKYYLHELMTRVAHGPAPSEHHFAVHIDGNRENNICENLEWRVNK